MPIQSFAASFHRPGAGHPGSRFNMSYSALAPWSLWPIGGASGKKEELRTPEIVPMLKTVEQISKISGIGENKLRELMENRELEYVQNSSRRLIADKAIWKWYEQTKPPALAASKKRGG